MDATAEVGQGRDHSSAELLADAGLTAWPQMVVWGATICLVLGLLWRVLRYLLQFPIWGDEAFILVDVAERDYAGLTQTMSFNQVAPLLFLWCEKLVVNLFGTS